MLRSCVVAALWLAGSGLAREMQVDMAQHDMYASGAVMAGIMEKKMATWDARREAGAFQSEHYPELNDIPCVGGLATGIHGDKNNTFKCSGLDLVHFKSHTALGSKTGEGSSSWGWTSPGGREFVAIGQADGAAFAEITEAGKLVYLGRLPAYSKPIIWREIRGYKHYMIIGSEAVGHGIQIFDMKKLLRIDPKNPVTFSNKKDLTGYFNDLPIGRTHNVVINEETDWVYAVGAQPRNDSCKAGLIFVNVTNPANPTKAGCASADGYVHDAQCLIYRGPMAKYRGKEICYGYNEDSLTIYDVTNKAAPTIISRTAYEGVSYCHQGWVLDKMNQEWLIMDDELDEDHRKGLAADGRPVTYIWDIRDLEHPKQTGHYKGNVVTIDHNQYIHGDYSYQSNYGAGLRILDISSIPEDPTGASVKEVAFFDIYPEDDDELGGGVTDFQGSWSSYAGFPSGHIFVNTIERGGFVLKMQDSVADGRNDNGEDDDDDEDRR